MKLRVSQSNLAGSVDIPASKSHTIRAVLIASLAEGVSEILNPLNSLDTQAAVEGCRAFGARIQQEQDRWFVTGTGGRLKIPEDVVNVGNSGTTLYFLLGTAALAEGYSVITGDEQIRKRPAQVLIDALKDLGAEAFSTRGNGMAPIVVRGRMKGGHTAVRAITSQYVSSLLLNCPLAEGDTEFEVTELNEQPYVQMTLNWLASQGIRCEHEQMRRFHIKGNQRYHAYKARVAADFSSATFFLCAGAITDSDITLRGLDMSDSQGDKAVVQMLKDMGARIDILDEGIRVRGGELKGMEIDMNATPDALPAMSVVGAWAEGTTRLVNVPQARVKETDRIAVMREELTKMGAKVEELPDGLVIRGGKLKGTEVSGHGDHRVVMALAVAGLVAEGETTIDTAEAAAVTFPNFVDLMQKLGAKISRLE